jgi:GT2 family glycosyltransferase
MVLDNDTEIPEGDFGWLERFVGELEEGGPSTGCVGATTNFANPPQHILTSPTTYTAAWSDEKSGRVGLHENPAAPWFISFAVLFKKDVMKALGPWDDRYNPGNWEDTDYSMSMRCAGYEIRVARSVYIHHKGHTTFGTGLKRLLEDNAVRFQQKWGVGRLWDMGFITTDQVKNAMNQGS